MNSERISFKTNCLFMLMCFFHEKKERFFCPSKWKNDPMIVKRERIRESFSHCESEYCTMDVYGWDVMGRERLGWIEKSGIQTKVG